MMKCSYLLLNSFEILFPKMPHWKQHERCADEHLHLTGQVPRLTHALGEDKNQHQKIFLVI